MIVTDGCVHALNRLEVVRPGATVGKRMRAHFLETYVTERVTSRGLGGYRLLRKKE